jgi:V/A-type H+/Na+-transporting ATPase subunit D
MLHGIAANRMTLMKTRRRLAVARRGHTLMKHKLEELMRIFQMEVEHAMGLENEAHAKMREVYAHFQLGQALTDASTLAGVLSAPTFDVDLRVADELVLNMRLPVLECTSEAQTPPYGLFATNDDLDESSRRLRRSLPLLLRLAQSHRRLALLINELETTHRRVNALEYVLIPQLEEETAVIQMKLDEIERFNVSRLMRIKSVIRKDTTS